MNTDKQINHVNYGKLVYDVDGKPVCHICGKSYKKLLSHVIQTHKITGDEYRDVFGLDKRTGLVAEDTKKKLQDAVIKNYDTIVVKNLLHNGKQTRFANGCKGRTKDMVSEQTKQKLLNNLGVGV